MNTLTKTIPMPKEADTLALGARLGALLQVGDIIALTGELGAGKTTLARGCINALCGVDEVPSPTYTLVQTYPAPRFELYHMDLYRLEKPDDAFELGIDEAFDFGVSLIEWPDRLGTHLPKDHLNIDIGFHGEGRRAELTAGPSWKGRLDAV